MTAPLTLALVGAGVRGTQFLLRLAQVLADQAHAEAPLAEHPPAQRFDIHVIDPWPDGAGRTWRTDQSPLLVMNGPAVDTTAFPDVAAGEEPEGPGLFAWCRLVAAGEIAGLPEWAVAECRTLDTDTFASRPLYGHYLQWVFGRAIAAMEPFARVHLHAERALSHEPLPGHRARLALSDGTSLDADAVVLALGWLPAVPSPVHRSTAEHRWISPAHPADQPLEGIAGGEPVIVRGLGMSFFDSAILLTQGRGGVFEPAPSPDGVPRFVYRASGREPHLIAGSRRGVTYRSKPPHGRAAAAPHAAVEALIAQPRPVGGWDFATQILPAIAQDATWAYYVTLAQHRPGSIAGSPEEFLAALRAAPFGDWEALIARAVPARADRFDLAAVEHPAGERTFASAQEVQAWVTGDIEADLAEAVLAERSPLKAAMRSLGEGRKVIAPLIEFSGISAASWPAYRQFRAFGAMLSGGPPSLRNAQLLALHSAGVLTFVGPGMHVAADGGGYVATSIAAPGVTYRAGVLLDAWMDGPTVTETADDFLASLARSGHVRPHQLELGVPTGALEVEPHAGRVVMANGHHAPRMFCLGIPLEGQRIFTILSPAPGMNSSTFTECLATARAVADLLAH